MTTIAVRNAVMAVDRCVTNEGLRYQTDQKLHVVDGWAFAITGDIAPGLAFVDWIRKGKPADMPCQLTEDCEVVAMNIKTGVFGSWEKPGVFIESQDAFEAWGSGARLAIGAMAFGATAEEAVKIAAAWDDSTGFGVITVQAEKVPRRQRRKKSG